MITSNIGFHEFEVAAVSVSVNDSCSISESVVITVSDALPDINDTVSVAEDVSVVTSASSENDFSGDSNCIALWNFESGALTTDSKGSNTLTDNNTVGTETSDYKQGSACADFVFANTEYFTITDANLDAAFPLKSTCTTKKITMCGWVKVDIDTTCILFGKRETATYCFEVDYLSATNKILLGLGYDSGASRETVTHDTALVVGRWYHIAVTHDDSDKSYRIRIWDDYNSTILGTDKTGNFTENIFLAEIPFSVGAGGDALIPVDGKIDELVVFDKVLSTDEIDNIRSGTYASHLDCSVFDTLSLAELSSVSPLLINSNVIDTVSLEEVISLTEENRIFVIDTTSVNEDVGSAASLGGVIVYSSISLADIPALSFDGFISVSSEVSISEEVGADYKVYGPELHTDANAASPDAQVLGSEAVTAQNDRDFSSGNIGNWSVANDGAGTCAYNTDSIGGADDKQALLSSSGDGFLYALLPDTFLTLATNTTYKIKVKVYVPSANTIQIVKLRMNLFDGNPEYTFTPTLDTYVEIVVHHALGTDITGNIVLGFHGNPADGDLLYFDDFTIKPVTSGEADLTTGWAAVGLTSTGANVFESQGVVKSIGSYALHTDANDTPTADARIYVDLSAAPFSCSSGKHYNLTEDIRHIGTGGDWNISLGNDNTGNDEVLAVLESTDTTFDSKAHTFQYSAVYRYLVIRETSGTNDGGVYVDNLSCKEIISDGLQCGVTDLITISEDINHYILVSANVVDTISLAESIDLDFIVTHAINVFSLISITENVSVLLPFLVPEVSDSITVQDTADVYILLESVVYDSVGVTESTVLAFESSISVSDNVSVSEDLTVFIFVNTYSIAVNDTVSVSESTELSPLDYYRSLSDGVVVSETVYVSVSLVTAVVGLLSTETEAQSIEILSEACVMTIETEVA